MVHTNCLCVLSIWFFSPWFTYSPTFSVQQTLSLMPAVPTLGGVGGDARHFPLSPPEFSIALLSAAPGDPTPSGSSAEERWQWEDRTQYNPSVLFTQFEASLRFIYYTAPSVSVHVFSLSRLGSWDDTMLHLFLFCCCDQTPSPEAGMMPQHWRTPDALSEDLGWIYSVYGAGYSQP